MKLSLLSTEGLRKSSSEKDSMLHERKIWDINKSAPHTRDRKVRALNRYISMKQIPEDIWVVKLWNV